MNKDLLKYLMWRIADLDGFLGNKRIYLAILVAR